MNRFKKCAVKALSLAVALITALSVGTSVSAAKKTADVMSNDWSFLVVFFKSVDVKVEFNGKTVTLKKTIDNAEINKIKNDIIDRMPYQFMQDTHGKVGIDAIDYAYVDEPLTTKDLKLAEAPADYLSPGSGKGYRPDTANSKLVRGVLDECLEQNHYSQILLFSPLDEISGPVGWGGSKYDGVHIAHIIMPHSDFDYYATILHEICHGLETDSKAMNNKKTVNLHDMYYYEISELDWCERYMNDELPDGKKGVEPKAFYRLRNEKHTPLTGDLTVTAPQNLSAAAKSDTAAALSWVGITGNGYQVGVFKDADHKKLQTTYDKKSGEASHELTDLKKGTTYYFGVRAAAAANGKTYYSDWTYLTYVHGGAVGAVKNFRVEAISGDRFKFRWDAVPNASGYQIARFSEYFILMSGEPTDYKAKTLSAVTDKQTSYAKYYYGIRASETVAGKKVWSDWTYLAFWFRDGIEVFDGTVRPGKTKTPTSILDLSATVKTQTYTGKPRTPDVTIKDGDKTLKNEKDYALIYKNNTEIGIASVKVEAMGDYCDEGTLYFLIVPKKPTLTATRSGEKITLKWDASKGADKYEICYREKGGKYKVLETVSGSKTSYSTTKLDKNKTYQFKIRSYAELDGKKYCSSYSKAVTVK